MKNCKDCTYDGCSMACMLLDKTTKDVKKPWGMERESPVEEKIIERIQQQANLPAGELVYAIPMQYVAGIGTSFDAYAKKEMNRDGKCPFWKRKWWKFWL